MAENQVFDPTSIILPESIDPTEEAFDTSSIIIPQKTEAQKILEQKNKIDKSLFKSPTIHIEPDGTQIELGVVQVNNQGSTIINDKSAVTTLLGSEEVPYGAMPDEFAQNQKLIEKKKQLKSAGYKLIDINTGEYYGEEKEPIKRGFWDVIKEGFKNLDSVPFISTAIDFKELETVYGLSKKFEDGTITEEEENTLYDWVEKNDQEYDDTCWAKVGQGLMDASSFG